MIEDTLRRTQRDRQLARRRGVAPSQTLKPHFVALARQICHWASLRDNFPNGRGLTLGVTSLAKGAGKSTVSFNLANALTTMARSRVLLLESDFGNPYISRRLGHAKSAGFSDVLTGQAEFLDVVQPTPLSDVSVLGCGSVVDQQSVDLPFDLLPHLFEEQLGEFGYVVVDLPVATNLTACYSIMPHIDGVILAVDANHLDQRQIVRFRQQTEQQGIEVIGVVINKR